MRDSRGVAAHGEYLIEQHQLTLAPAGALLSADVFCPACHIPITPNLLYSRIEPD